MSNLALSVSHMQAILRLVALVHPVVVRQHRGWHLAKPADVCQFERGIRSAAAQGSVETLREDLRVGARVEFVLQYITVVVLLGLLDVGDEGIGPGEPRDAVFGTPFVDGGQKSDATRGWGTIGVGLRPDWHGAIKGS